MKNLTTLLSILLFTLVIHAQDSVLISDFESLNHTEWKGTLTYMDYQSGEPTTIETMLQITIEGNGVKSNMQYVYEPHKNNKSSVSIKKDGTYYGNEKIVSNTINNDTRTIVTTYEGKDNGEKVTMFITHKFNDTNYTISKKVVYKNTKESLVRNTYKFSKLK